MRIHLKFTDQANQWMTYAQTTFVEGLAEAGGVGLVQAGDWMVEQIRQTAPELTGDLKNDFRREDLKRPGKFHRRVRVRESTKLFVTGEWDQKIDPFSYARAQDTGAEPHSVSLYAFGRGRDTKARKKLRKWARQLYPGLPEKATTTQKEFDQWNQKREKRGEPKVSPWIFVHPRGNLYFSKAVDNEAQFVRIVGKALKDHAVRHWGRAR